MREQVLSRAGRYREVQPERPASTDSSPLKVKEVWVEDRRYVVCLNPEQARKDVADREAILAALSDSLGAVTELVPPGPEDRGPAPALGGFGPRPVVG